MGIFPGTYAQAVKALRDQRDWTQEQLARETDFSLAIIAKWEQGVRPVSRKSCAKLAQLASGEVAAFFLRHAGAQPVKTAVLVAVGSKNPKAMMESEAASRRKAVSPESREFNNAALHGALSAVLERATPAARQKLIEKLVHSAVTYSDWNPDEQMEDSSNILPFPNLEKWPEIKVLTTERWREGSEDRLRYLVQVPVLVDADAAGSGREISEVDIDSFLTLPSKIAQKGPGKYVGIYADGDSMEPVIKDGTVCVVDPDRREIAHLRGKVVAVRLISGIGAKVVIKRLAGESKKERLIFHSDNAHHKDIIVERPRYNPIVGEVVFLYGEPAVKEE